MEKTSIENTASEQLVNLFETFQKDPFFWIEKATGMVPQPPKQHSLLKVSELLTCSLDRFEQIAHDLTLADFEPFEKGKHITWQQTIIIIAYARALNDSLPRRIAIITGKGLGKTAVVSWLLCHFLYSFPLAKIMATAPTSDQMFAALWSEVAKIISEMREPFKNVFEWQTAFVRHKEAPYTAFARAKTADSIEALRGIHASSMMALVDESSGVDDDIINTGWSTMTNENKIMILISNFSGNESLIERIHSTQDSSYTKLRFSTEDSPIVDQKEVKRRKDELISKGIDPRKDRDYCIDILGIAPPDTSEFAGWYRFFSDDLIDKVLRPVSELDNTDYRQRPALGVDPAGEGNDTAPGILRSFKWAKEMFELNKSTSDMIAGAIATVFDNVPFLVPSRVYVDSFGVGHDVSQKVLVYSSDSKKRVIRSVLVGEQPPDSYKARYINIRAFIYDAMRIWFENGGRIETDVADAWRKELKSIYAKKTAAGKLQIMGKAEMKVRKLPSPNKCFVAGTLIKTPKGDVPIEKIKAGNLVYTPTGVRAVLDTQKQKVSKTFTLKTLDLSLTGTGNHRIFTQTRGLVPIDALSFTFNHDILDTWENQKKKMYQKLLSLMVGNFGYRHAVNTTWQIFTKEQEKLEEKRNSYITQCRNFITTVKSLLDFKYITKTTISITTTSQILSYSRLKNTEITTQNKIKNGGKKILSFVKNNLFIWRKRSLKEILNVANVKKSSKQKSALLNYAHENAHLKMQTIAEGTTLKNNASTALKNLLVINIKIFKIALILALLSLEIVSVKAKLFAISVIKNLLQPNQKNIKHAVAIVTTNLKEEVVYNISVDKDNCYYANNILVSNCDALSLSFYMDAPMVIDGIYRPLQEVRNDGYGYTPNKSKQDFNPHSLIPNGF